MHILTRRVTEQIRVGDAITVAILAIKGNCVRIGVEVPKHISVDRKKSTSESAADRALDRMRCPLGDERCGY
jgi:carbon storage regulator